MTTKLTLFLRERSLKRKCNIFTLNQDIQYHQEQIDRLNKEIKTVQDELDMFEEGIKQLSQSNQ